ncbi:MAG: FemAB family PEP-CTERM system-associated protein [Alphaproteobacteria bacterium]|nr:FemAB family PEP-CTERM system-associated protein [Alphaproteobacteria bacterium]
MPEGSAALAVRTLTDDRAADWDAFVARCPAASFFHRAGWRRVIEHSFGHRSHYLFAEQDGAIRGILPLVHIKSRLFGNALISNPFCVYGGPAALDEAAREALDSRAEALMIELDADCLEYRALERMHPDWPAKDDLYATFRRRIDADPERNLKAIPRKQRAVIRQSLERNLAIAEESDVECLFRLYAESVRNLGTPVFAKRYLQSLKDTFGEDCRITIVRHEGAPICGVMSFYFRDEVLPYYAGARPAARGLGAYDFMYWHILREAGARGLAVFDFGRSKRGTGAFAFKKNWGFTPQPIFHEYRLKPGCAIPDINPLNPKYRLFIAAWKHLPLPLANRLGPLLARDLG